MKLDSIEGGRGEKQKRLGEIKAEMRQITEELPEEIRFKFQTLSERLTSSEPIGGEGSVKASAKNLSTSEAVETAQDILYMASVIETARIE